MNNSTPTAAGSSSGSGDAAGQRKNKRPKCEFIRSNFDFQDN